MSSYAFSTLNAPGTLDTEALGINDVGQIVGFNGIFDFSKIPFPLTPARIVFPSPPPKVSSMKATVPTSRPSFRVLSPRKSLISTARAS
jgi:hypothetical protein